MKILQLCKKFPYPLKDGESIAVNSLSKSLHQLGCEITLLAMNTSKHFFEVDQLPKGFNHYTAIHTVPIDNQIRVKDALTNLFTRDSYHITRFISPSFREQLIRLLRENDFDLVQLETLYLAPYIADIRKHSKATIAMRAHNVEHEIWERITENTKLLPKKWYLDHLTKKLKRFEVEQLNTYDLLVAITGRDLQSFRAFGYDNKAVVTPIGIDTKGYRPDYNSFQQPLSISFIGSLDWMPNLEGLNWFLDKIWGKIPKNCPDLKLNVAGRNTPDWMHQMKKKNVVVHGEVPDALDFINEHSVMVVPLLSGSGMRAKILEGMALGKVVITTTLGLEGIPAKNRSQVIIADSPEEFVEALQFCYKNPAQLMEMGKKARNFVIHHFDSLRIAQKLVKAYQSVTVEAL